MTWTPKFAPILSSFAESRDCGCSGDQDIKHCLTPCEQSIALVFTQLPYMNKDIFSLSLYLKTAVIVGKMIPA
jgi:hypothetical protein